MLAQPLRLIARGCAGEASPSAARASPRPTANPPALNNNPTSRHNRRHDIRACPEPSWGASRRRRHEHRAHQCRRPYHSRWAVSVYGKDPSVPPEDYEGYDAELAEFEKNGSRYYKSLDANRKPGDGALTDEERRERARARRREAENRGAEGGDPLGNLGMEDWDDDDEDPLHSVGGVHSDDEDDAAAFVDRDEDGRPLYNQLPGGIGARALALGYNPRTAEDPVLEPGLYLVGTPIGNLEDITLRALRILRSADAVLCEDTRHTKRLLARYSIEPLKLVSYHAHNERRRREPLLDKMRRGASLALVSDAGTPGVADPGADIAAACAEEGIAVFPIPGPSAAAAAVAMAGIPVDEGFTFCGFLPPKSGARRKKLETLRLIKGSLVAFVPPHKLVNTLKDCAEALGDRNCCVCREMTKVRAAVPVVFGFWFLLFGFVFSARARRAAMITQIMCLETARLEPRISRMPSGLPTPRGGGDWQRCGRKHTTKA